MLNDNAKKWVEALRSGKYKQGTINLCRNNKYCCLGVLCEIAIENGLDISRVDNNGNIAFDGDFGGITKKVQEWIGIPSSLGIYSGRALSSDNDQGKTFQEIADIIESEPKGLFKE